jgi:hypothetical protein
MQYASALYCWAASQRDVTCASYELDIPLNGIGASSSGVGTASSAVGLGEVLRIVVGVFDCELCLKVETRLDLQHIAMLCQPTNHR